MSTFYVVLRPVTEYRREHYGVTHESVLLFETGPGGNAPTAVEVWSNVKRPNPRNGEPVRYSNYGRIDGGVGKFLDPHNEATDSVFSVLLSPQASVISNSPDPARRRYAVQEQGRIVSGDTLVLIFPDGTDVSVSVRMTNNGHGGAVPQ